MIYLNEFHLQSADAEWEFFRKRSRGCYDSFYPYQFFPQYKELSELIHNNAEGSKTGVIITGDQFITSRAQKRQLRKRFPEALAVEMEGCSVAHACYVNGVPFAIIRCISDLADNGAEDSYDAFEQKAAEKSASVIIKTVGDLK